MTAGSRATVAAAVGRRRPALELAAVGAVAAALACAAGVVGAPSADAVGSGEAIAVTAYNHDYIRIYNSSSDPIHSFGGTGTGEGQFRAPRAIDFHPYGIIAVADHLNHNVQVFYPNGTFAFRIGSGAGCADGQFNQPTGVAVGPDGTIAVGNTLCNHVQVFYPNGTFAFKIGTSGNVDGKFNRPRGIDFGPGGTIAVTDTFNNRIQVFNPNGTYMSQFGRGGSQAGQFHNPFDVAFLADGGFAVVDRGRHNIQLFEPDGSYAAAIGSRGNGNGQFDSPSGVAAGPGGKIAVADANNDRIQVFGPGTAFDRAFAASGHPQGVAYGPADAHNATVRVAGVSSTTEPGGYRQGSAIDITVRFTGNVEVDTEPALALTTWPPRNATYVDGNRTDALRFVYDVRPGDSAADLDYTGMAALLLDGGAGAIRPADDGAIGTASPVLPHPGTPGSLGSPSGIRIIPHASVVNVSTTAANATYGAGQNITIRVDFGEDVIVSGAPVLRLSTDPPAAAVYTGDTGTPVSLLEFAYTVGRGEAAALLTYSGSDALSLAGGPGTSITDVADHPVSLALPAPGSPGSLSHYSRIAIDGSDPAGPSGPVGAGPPAPVILTPPASVSNATLVIEGTAGPGHAVRIYSNNTAVAATTANPTSGYWRAAVDLDEGRSEITARATNAAGVTSAFSPATTVILDTMPPPVPTILNADGEVAPSRAHVVRGTAEPGVLVEVFVNGTLGGSSAAHWRTGLWHILVVLEPGDNSVTARTLDGLGNPSAPAAARIVGPDTVAPSTTLDGPDHVSSIGDRHDEVMLVAPHDIRAFESNGRAYAMVAASGSSVVQIVDFTDPRAPRIAGTIPNADGRNLAFPRDIEIFTSDQGTTAAVTSLYSNGVELINIDDPLSPNLAITGSASYRDTGEDGSSRFPQLLGARDAAVFTATVNGTAGTYLAVVSDFGSTSIGPGGFQIVNVTNAASPTPVYSNHRMAANGTGSYEMSRPPSETLLGPGSNPSSWSRTVADPRIVAVFDGDGDPVARTHSVELPGYGRAFSVPIEGLYTIDQGTDPRWSISLNTVIEKRNSTGHTISATRGGVAFEFPGEGTCTRADPCTGQYRLIVLGTNDTNDLDDDYIMEVYRNDLLGTYEYPVAKLVNGKMLSVGLDGEPFEIMGLDADGNRFEVLEGAAAVETFESGGGTYAVVAARDDDGVQIINLTDPTSPRAVAAARDGDGDGASGTFDELDGAAGVGIAGIGGGTYAVVAARDDDGVQIINLTDPADPRAVSSIADEQGASRNKFSMLGGAIGVHIFEQGGRTYAIVSAEEDNGFQVIDITDPARPRAVDRGHDGSRCSTAARYNTLGGAIASDTLAFGGRLYAVVAANLDYGMQVVDITDPERLVVLGAVTDDPGGFTELHEPIAAESVEIDGATYVLVASYRGSGTTPVGGDSPLERGGVQIIDVSDPPNPRAAAAIRQTYSSELDLLHGPRDIDTFVVASRTYAIVTAESTPGHTNSDGKGSFLIFDITQPERPRFVSGMRDGQPDGGGGRFDMLNAPAGVETARIGDRTYAVIAARGPWLPSDGHIYNGPHGVQIVDVSDPRRPLAVASIQDEGADASGRTFDTLERAHGVDIAQVGSGWYALVTSIRDDGVQVINITDPSSPEATASITNAATDTRLDGANAIKAFKSGGSTYAIVTAKHGNSLQILDITDPASPSHADAVSDGEGSGSKRFSELNHVYGVDTFTHNGDTYALTACEEGANLNPAIKDDHSGTVKGQVCSGVQIIDMSDPTSIQPGDVMYNRHYSVESYKLLGARGVATFTAGGSTYAAVTGFQDDGVEIVKLATGSDTAPPGVVRVELNQERGILRITFDEPVKTSQSDFDLGSIRIRNATGSSAPVQLAGASLSGATGGPVVEVALTEAQRSGAAAFASPLLNFTAAGAFEDLSGNSLPKRDGVAAEVVTSRPELLGASLNLGTGDIELVFTEAVNSSGLDLSKIAVYSPGDPDVRYFPSEAFTEDGNAEIGVWLGEAARQAVAGLAGSPVLDVLDGAVESSVSGRPSAERRGVVFMPLLEDRVDPVLLSALLSGGNLTLEFSEHVNVSAAAFKLDQMYVCDGFYTEDGSTCEGSENGFSLAGSSILTTGNGALVIVRLGATQASDAESYARPVLDLRLDGPYSAVQDLSGQGIGKAAVAVSKPTLAGGFLARAISPDTIRVSFGAEVSANATDPGTTWVLGGPDAGGLAVTGYDGMRGAPSTVLTLSGNLSGTRPNLSLEYMPDVGDVTGPDGSEIAGATVSVSDGIPPVVVRAVVTSKEASGLPFDRAVVVTYSERVWAHPGAYKNATIYHPSREDTFTDRYVDLGGNGSERHVVAYNARSSPESESTGYLTADPRAIRDEDGNALGAGETYRIVAGDGSGPSLWDGSEGTLLPGNRVALHYTSPALAPQSAYLRVVIAGETGHRNVTSVADNSTANHLIGFDGGPVSPTAGAAIFLDETAVRDGASNPMGGNRNARVGVYNALPYLTEPISALVTGPNNATIRFVAPVIAPGSALGPGYPDALYIDGVLRGVDSSDRIAGDTWAFEFAGDPAPTNATGSVRLSWIPRYGGGTTDVPLADGQRPGIASSEITGPDRATIRYSEPVKHTSAYDTVVLSPGSAQQSVVSSTGTSLAVEHVIEFDTDPPGAAAAPNATGMLSLAAGSVTDAAGLTLGTGPLNLNLTDGQHPYIVSARIVDGLHAAILYSEAVSAPHAAYHSAEVPDGSQGQPSTVVSGNGTSRHVITLGQYVTEANATGTAVINAALAVDIAGNGLEGPEQVRQALEDGRPPEVVSAEITAGNTLTVIYTEPVTAPLAAYTVGINNTARAAASLGGNGTALHEVGFAGMPVQPGTGAGNVTIDGRLVLDLAEPPRNRLGDGPLAEATTDGRPVVVTSASVTGPGVVTVLYEDHGVAPQRFQGLSIDNIDRTALPQPASGGEVEVQFTSATVQPNSTGWIVIDGVNHTVRDGQAPSVTGAAATSLRTIRVAFDEPVAASASGSGAGGWSVSGTDVPAGLAVSGRSIPASDPAALDLALDADLADTRPDGVAVSYASGGGMIVADAAGNSPAALGPVPVADGIPPVIDSARITGGGEAVIRYSEKVSAPNAAYENVEVPSGDADPRQSVIRSGNGSRTHTIAFGGDRVEATNATGTAVILTALVADEAGNALAGPERLRQALGDGRPPEVVSANITAGNALTITYSEPATAPRSAYSDITVNGTARSNEGLAGDMTDSHTIAFNGTAVPLNATGSLTLNEAAVLDLAAPPPNPLGQAPQVLDMPYGHVPEINSARITGPGTITIQYSRSVTAQPSAYGPPDIDGLARAIAGAVAGNGGRTHEIQFTAANASADATGSITINASAIVDRTGVELGNTTALALNLTDGQNPSVVGVVAVSRGAIEVEFDEAVTAPPPSADGLGGWSVAGGAVAAGGLSLSSLSDISAGSTVLTLTLDGILSGTHPGRAEVSYDDAAGLVYDAAGNALGAVESRRVADGIDPELVRAAAVDPDYIVVEYSEPVSAAPNAAYLDITLFPGNIQDSIRNHTLQGDTHTIWFMNPGAASHTGTDGLLAVNGAMVTDGAGNALGPAGRFDYDVADGQRPELVSAAVRNETSILVEYSEPVSAPVEAYSDLDLGDTGTRTFTAVEEDRTANHVVVFAGGTPAPADSMGTMTINETAVLDLADPPNELGPDDEKTITLDDDTRMPEMLSAKVTGSDTITVMYSRAVTARMADYTSIMVDGIAWSGPGMTLVGGDGSATHTITFTGAAAAANATGTMMVNETAIESMGGGSLGDGPGLAAWNLTDGQKPSIKGAAVVSRTEILVRFDEPVTDPDSGGGTGADGWSVRGGEAEAPRRDVASRDNIADFPSQDLVLRLDGDLPDDSPSGILLSYAAAGSGPVTDLSRENELDPVLSLAVADGIRPSVRSANLTGDREVTITYSEPVKAPEGAYVNVSLAGGTTLGIAGIADNGTAVHVLTLSGAAAVPRGTMGNVTIDASAVLDYADPPNRLGGGSMTVDLGEGREVSVVSSMVTGPGNLTVRLSAAAVQLAYGALSIDGMGRTVTDYLGGGTDTHVILFDGGDAAPNATGWFVVDPSSVLVGRQNLTLADGQAPSIENATAVSRGTIHVLFDEAVSDAGPGAGGWSVSGDDAPGGLAVLSRAALPGDPSTLVLTLDGNLRDTVPDEAALSYDPASGSARDAALNDLNSTTASLVDGIRPGVESARITAGNTVTIVYSEPVARVASAYTNLNLAQGGSRAATGPTGAADATHVITFTGAAAATSETGTITVDQTAMADAAGNALGTNTAYSQALADGQAPAVLSANITAGNAITIVYSEPVARVAAAYTNLNLVQGGSRAATGPTGAPTAEHPITFAGAAAATSETGTITVDQTAMADAAGNALGTNAAYSQALADGQAPAVLSANITAGNAITIVYTEPVARVAAAYTNLNLAQGGSRAATGPTGAADATHAITFTGAAAATSETGTITVDQTAMADAAGNALGAGTAYSQALADGQAPAVLSANITAGNAITIVYSEPVARVASAYTSLVLSPGGSRTVTGPAGAADATHSITFDGSPAATSATGTIAVDQTAMADAAGNALGAGTAYSQALADGQAPAVLSANITAGNAITIVYSEPVARVASAYTNLNLAQGGSRTVTGPAGAADATHSITFDGSPAATSATGTIAVDQTAMADAAGNALGTSTAYSQALADGQAPAVLSANITAGNAITIVYSEPVARVASAYTNLNLAQGGSRAATGPTGAPTAEHPITFTGAAAATSETGTITVDQTAMADAAGNALGTNAAYSQALADGQAPAVLSANITAGNAITIVYTEPVARVASAYTNLVLLRDGPRTVTGPAGAADATHVITFGGRPAATSETGTITVDQTAMADAAGNALGTNAAHSQALADGQAPAVVSAGITAGNTLTVTYSEPVTKALSAYTGLVLSPGGPRAPTGLPGPTHPSHSITFDGSPAAKNATGAVNVDRTALADAAGNALGTGTLAQALADAQRPTVNRTAVTGANNLTVRYTEPVDALEGAYSGIVIGAGTPMVTGIAGNTTATHVVTFGGDPAPLGVTGSVTLNRSAVLDRASPEPNRMGSGTEVFDLHDDRAPSIISAEVTGPGNATITYSRTVTAQVSDYQSSIWIAGKPRTATSLADGAASDTHVILFRDDDAPPNATGSIVINAANILDENNTPLGSGMLNTTLGDGQAPTISGAAAISLGTIRVTFDEPVNASGTSGDGGWSVSGGDADGLSVSSRTNISSGSAVLVLVLSGDLRDTDPAGVSVSYTAGTPTTIPFVDGAGNELGTRLAVGVADEVAPAVKSANITAGNTVTIEYTEPVARVASAYTNLNLVQGGSRAATGPTGTADATHVITFTGAAAATSATGTITVDQTAMADAAGNALGTSTAHPQALADGQRPAVVSANITAGNAITIVYSEPVARVASAYTSLSLVQGGPRASTGPTGAPSAEHAITFAGAEAATSETGTIAVDQTAMADAAGNTIGTNAAYPQALADGQRPAVVSANITAGNALIITYSEPVARVASAYTSLNLVQGGPRASTGPTGAPSAEHAITFAGAEAATSETGTIAVDQTAMADAAGNALGTSTAYSQALADGQRPAVVSARITAGNALIITYSEPVARVASAYTNLVLLPGGLRTVTGPSGAADATHVIAFGGSPAATSATGTITVDQTAMADAAGNALGTDAAYPQALANARAPAVVSARITAGNTVTITYSEPVTPSASAYTNLVLSPGGPRTVTGPSGAADATHVITFGGSPAATSATGTMTVDQTAMADAAGNALGTNAAHSLSLADAQRPAVVSARITAVDTVTIEYSEPVARVASAYSDLVLSPGGPRTVTGPAGAPSAGHAIRFDGLPAAVNATGTMTVDQTAMADAAGNALGTDAAHPQALADGQAPMIEMASITAGNTVAIVYNEPVEAPLAAYRELSFTPGGTRAFTALDGSSTAVHVVTFGGDLAPSDANATVTIDATAVTDLASPAPNRLGADAGLVWSIVDERNPSIRSAEVTGRGTATIAYDRPVVAQGSAYSMLVVDGANRTIAALGGNGTARHHLAFEPADAPPNATGSVRIDEASVSNADGGRLGAELRVQDLADGQDPAFAAVAISLDTLRVEFTEPVSASGTSGAGGWSVSGPDAEGLSVSARSDISSGSALLVLTLDGRLADTDPAGVELSYAGGGLVADAGGNEPRPGGAEPVADGIAPEIESAAVSGGNTASILYTEAVSASADPPAYTGLVLEPGGARAIASFAAGPAQVHDVEFGGTAVLPGTTGSLAIDGSLVLDGAGNAVRGGAAFAQDLEDGQSPPTLVPAAADAMFATPNTVRVEYSAALGAPPSHGGPVYAGVEVGPASGPAGAADARPVLSESGIGTALHTVRFGGDPIGAGRNGSILLAVDLQADAVGPNNTLAWFGGDRIPVRSGEALRTVDVTPAQPARVVEIVRDSFERTVNATSAGDAARPAIDVTGLAPETGAGGGGAAAGRTAVFPPGEGVRVLASFAELAIPPNATARGLPADGLLELYVAPSRPNATDLAAALGIEAADAAPGAVRVVEVGDPATRIVFDLPVRILLAGQAGGLAFYVNTTADGNETVVPIGAECGADDTAAVHAQLGGSGECQIDSGADKAIHTYHLTLFGTVRVAGDPPPPIQPPVVVVAPPAPPAQQPGGVPFFAGGGGRGGGGGGGGGGSGGSLALPADGPSAVVLHSATWDCGEGTMRIVVGGAAPDPTVTVLSSGGSEEAELVGGLGLQGLPAVYEAALPDDTILSIRAVSADGRAVSTASEVVRTGGACTGEVAFGQGGGAPSAAAAPDAAGGEVGDAGSGAGGDAAGSGAGAAGTGSPTAPSGAAVAEPEPSEGAAGAAPALGSGAGAAAGAQAAGGDGVGRPAFEMEEGRGAAYYVKRYAEQAEYREWFGAAYPQYADICEAVGAAPGCVEAHLEAAASGAAGDAAAGIVCRDGMMLRDGRCVPDADAAPEPDADAAPEPGAPGGGGCLVATAAYGTELAPQVQALREYRDGTLMATGHGQAAMAAFSAAYYAFSPHVADLEREHPALRHAIASLIAPLLHALQVAAAADAGSDLSVLAHGAAALLLAAGAYIGVPAAGAWAALVAAQGRRRRAAPVRADT